MTSHISEGKTPDVLYLWGGIKGVQELFLKAIAAAEKKRRKEIKKFTPRTEKLL